MNKQEIETLLRTPSYVRRPMPTDQDTADSLELPSAASEARPISGGIEWGSATALDEPFDENAAALDAWQADPDRARDDFYLSDRVPALQPVTPSYIPEAVILAGLVGVLVVIVYFALRVWLGKGVA